MVPDCILNDLVKVNNKKYVDSCQGEYPESLIKIGHDMADKA